MQIPSAGRWFSTDTRSLVLYVCFVDRCLSFCTFFLLAIVLSILLRFTNSDSPLVSSNSSSMGTPERRFPPTLLLWVLRKGGFHQLFFYGYSGKEVSTNSSSMGTPERRFPPTLKLTKTI